MNVQQLETQIQPKKIPTAIANYNDIKYLKSAAEVSPLTNPPESPSSCSSASIHSNNSDITIYPFTPATPFFKSQTTISGPGGVGEKLRCFTDDAGSNVHPKRSPIYFKEEDDNYEYSYKIGNHLRTPSQTSLRKSISQRSMSASYNLRGEYSNDYNKRHTSAKSATDHTGGLFHDNATISTGSSDSSTPQSSASSISGSEIFNPYEYANRDSSYISRSLSKTKIQQESDRDAHGQDALKSLNKRNQSYKSRWKSYYEFWKKSQPTDALVYAKTRREAWLQFVRTYKPGMDTGIMSLWAIMALLFLQKGEIIMNPEMREIIHNNRENIKRGLPSKKIILLEIEGVLRSPLSWQLALSYPDTVVYGYELSSYDFGGGPSNFVPATGKSFLSLPFKNNFFDSVTSRAFWYLLRELDWPTVISEIYRILKPGGYIELLVSDFEVINPDEDDKPWIELILNKGLKPRKMDPYPSKKIVKHLGDAGFTNINKTVIVLPRASNAGGTASYVTDFMIQFYWLQLVNLYGESFLTDPDAIQRFRNYCLKNSLITIDEKTGKKHHGVQRDNAPSQYTTFVYARKPL